MSLEERFATVSSIDGNCETPYTWPAFLLINYYYSVRIIILLYTNTVQ